jgi:hypothetical protein
MRKRGGFLLGVALLCGLALVLGAIVVLAQGSSAIEWWVIAGGGGPSGGSGVAVNDTLGQPVIGPSSSGDVGLSAGYWYAPPSAELHCGLAAGSYELGPEPEVNVTVETLGTLACLRVERVSTDHPNRTGSAGGSGVGWGGYWVITATDSLGAPAAGYAITLTLPHEGLSDPQVCKWLEGAGSGAGWDCARDGFDADSVWRGGVTNLSDWAVGEHVGPTSVSITYFAARHTSPHLAAGVGVLLIAALSYASGRVIRRRRSTTSCHSTPGQLHSPSLFPICHSECPESTKNLDLGLRERDSSLQRRRSALAPQNDIDH